MAENGTIESPDFAAIKNESGIATRDAINLLWMVANNEAAERRRGNRAAVERSIRKVKTFTPSAALHNFDAENCGEIVFEGSASVDFTGIRNGTSGELIVTQNLGTGVITYKHESASSDTSNRLDLAADADVTQATGETMLFRYLNSRWRQQVQAT